MARFAHASFSTLAPLFYLAVLGCSSSNDPSTPSSTAGTASTAPTAGSSSSHGGSSSGSTSQTSGGDSADSGGPAATGGHSSSSGGTAAAGSSPSGSAGSATNAAFDPLCDGLTTAAGPAPTKAGACNATDPQLCYKTCGPQGVGFKSETCTAGAYAEQSGCSFPDASDYSCFKIPAALDASCPSETITASSPCTVAACTPCADATGSYYDSKMNLKTGYCVCPMPGASGTSKWSCASTTAWPCPTGKGC